MKRASRIWTQILLCAYKLLFCCSCSAAGFFDTGLLAMKSDYNLIIVCS